MKITECSYCGALAITNQDICASCESLVSPEAHFVTENVVKPATDRFQQTGLNPAYPSPNNEFIPPIRENRNNFANPYAPTQPALDSKCLRCKTAVPRGQSKCFDCESKKTSSLKFFAVLTILAGLIGFFGFDYIYEKISPRGIFRKYAKTTGADDSLVFENFSLKGEARVTVISGFGFNAESLNNKLSSPSSNNQDGGDKFSFKMIYQKPNKSSIEFFKGDGPESQTAFKQVFDGVRGWKYTNMPNQPGGYQDTNDAFASKKMGLGLEDFDSVEFLNDEITLEFGTETIKVLSGRKNFEMGGVQTPTDSKVIVKGNHKRNGITESSLLVFDQQTGLLLGTIKNALLNNVPVTTVIYFNNYEKFSVNRKGYFGVAKQMTLVPTRMTFVTGKSQASAMTGNSLLMMDLNVKGLEIDAPIDENYFQKQ